MAGRTDRLLSAGFLRRLDATIDVQAHEVLAGTDRLADGELHFRLKDGRLLHFGTSLPQQAIVARLLSSLSDGGRTISANPAVVALPERLAQVAGRGVSSVSPSSADTN